VIAVADPGSNKGLGSTMSNLQFQSFTNQNFDMSDESPGGGHSGRLGDGSQEDASTASAGPKKNFFSFSFYQQYFDVDTDQVTKRLVNSVIPTHKNFITEFVQPIPDLYGPFWVCCTLVFSIGIFSNIAQYIENQGGAGEYGSDFRMVTGASSLIASYVLIIPFIISTTLWYRKADIQYSFLEVVCAYGYSLAIFIPVSMLWVIDIAILRWSLIFISVGLSGGVLVRSLAPAFANDPNKLIALGSVIVVIVLHFGLALCFKEYFFDAAMPSRLIPTAAPIAATTVPGETLPTVGTGGVVSGNESKPAVAALIAAPLQEITESNATTVAAKIEKRDNITVVVGKEEEKKRVEEVKQKTDEKKDVVPTASSSSSNTTMSTVVVGAAATKKEPEGISVIPSSNATVIDSEPVVVETTPKTNSTL
ncbi:hypothetical protein PENTCL1PPCAC_4412, partial [Pristionchus entomophagus]